MSSHITHCVRMRYVRTSFEELTSRYEEPREMNRWDAPLFTLHAGDDPYIEEMVYARVIDAIFKRRPQRVTFANLPVCNDARVRDVREYVITK